MDNKDPQDRQDDAVRTPDETNEEETSGADVAEGGNEPNPAHGDKAAPAQEYGETGDEDDSK